MNIMGPHEIIKPEATYALWLPDEHLQIVYDMSKSSTYIDRPRLPNYPRFLNSTFA
jgi:hypothetical protein